MSDANDKFMEALKRQFLSAAEWQNKTFADTVRVQEKSGPLIVRPPPVGRFVSDYFDSLGNRARAMYGVPEALLMKPGDTSGRAMAIAQEELYRSKIQGRKANFMHIDEAVDHKMEGNWETASSRHDDLTDSMASAMGAAMGYGTTATPSTFSGMPKSKAPNFQNVPRPQPTQAGIIRAVMAVPGVRNAEVVEPEPGLVEVHFWLKPGLDVRDVAPRIEEALDEVRPVGVKINLVLKPPEYELFEETDEQKFMKRLRSKLQERYPDGEE